MNRYLLPLILVILALTGTAHAAGGFDAVQLEYQRDYNGRLRWDDLFATDQWLGGEQPAASGHNSEIRGVELAPGKEVRLLLPAAAVLRVHAPGDKISAADIELFYSSGSPLFVQGETVASVDNQSLLFSPEDTRPLVCLVRRPSTASNPLRVAIFLSRQDQVPEIAPYRRRLDITGAQTLHFPLAEPADRRLNLLRGGEATTLDITGPLRLALVNRLLYRAGDTVRHQNYRLSARVDDLPEKIMEFASSPEEHLLFCPEDGCLVPGREERDFLEIPAGRHRLRLTADRDLLLNLLTRDEPDYLFPSLNAPETEPLDHARRQAEDNQSRPLWAISDQEALKTLTTPETTFPDLARTARKLARDNGRRPQGLLAAWLLRQRAATRRDDPELRALAEELYGNHTFFRDLFPYASDQPLDQRYLLYHNRRLARPDDTDLVLAQQHADELLGQMGHGYFTAIAAPSAATSWSALRYRLPPQDSPGILRVLVTPVNQPRAMRITVDGMVKTLRLEPELAQPAGSFILATSEAALEMLRQRYPLASGSTLDGPYAIRRQPAPLVEVATIDLPLPATAREITVAMLNEAQPKPLRLALQYRAGKPVFFNDREYQDALRLTAADPAFREQLRSQLVADQQPAPDLTAPQEADAQALFGRDIQNYAMATARLLASHRATYRSPVFSRPIGLTRLDPVRADASMTQARRAAAAANWLGALEHASQAALQAKGELWLAARRIQIQALRQLGEDYLAEGMLRELLLYPPPEIGDQGRAAAFQELAAQHRRDQQDASLLQLYAIRLAQAYSPALLGEYLDLLVANGYFAEALVAALLLPEAERPLPLMARAARAQNWPGTFQALVAKLPAAEDRAYWTGLALLDQGQDTRAQEELAAAGDRGPGLLSMLREGQAIRAGLMSGQPERQREAFRRWQEWQRSLPLPGSWQPAPWLVQDYAGSRTLYSTPLDLYGRAFLATEPRPLRLSFFGPARLRISARPLHDSVGAEPLNGWLELDDNGHRLFTDITGNLPAPGVRLAEDQDQVVGRMVVKEFPFAAGAHAVTVHANGIPVLVQVEVFQPDAAPSVLPLLTADTARRLLASPAAPFPVKPAVQGKNQVDLTDLLFSILPTDARPKANASTFAEIWQRNRTEEGVVPGQDAASADPFTDLLSPPPPTKDEQDPVARLNTEARQCMAAPGEPAACMTTLLRLAELSPPARTWAVARGEELFARHPAVTALKPLYARLTAGNTWQPVSAVRSPAGVRFLPIQGWQPESPLLRVRKALLGLSQDNERILYGTDRLLLSYKTLTPIRLRLDFLLAEPSFLKPEELALAYQLDAEREQPLTLSPAAPSAGVALEIPAGQHTVAVWISKRHANQFLRVRFTEPESGEKTGLTAASVRLVDQEERPYVIATPKEPVMVSVQGPGWLRVDELRGSDVLATYRPLAEGWQEIPLRPLIGQAEALFRVHQKVSGAKEAEPPLPRPALPAFTPVPGPIVAVSQPSQPPALVLHDALPLGDQQDATWEARAALVSRLGTEEDRKEGISDDYLELALIRRHADLLWPEHLKVSGLARLRESGAHTLGVLADYTLTPRALPATFLLAGEAYAQNLEPVDANGQNLDDTAGAVRVQGGISRRFDLGFATYHLPSAGLFARWLSMDRDTRFPAGSVDYDVFTRYKAEHRHGLTLADTLYHRPWLDTYWLAGARVVSNEDLNLADPDHVQANLAWRQLLGPFTAELALQLTAYLEDDDRRNNVDTRMLKFELAWDHWLADRNQLRIGLNIRNDLQGNTGGFLAVSWRFSPGRDLRNIRLSDAPFKDLQDRELLRDRDNTMTPAAPGYTLLPRP